MKKKQIPNTSKSSRPEWLFGGNPSAIENQEKEGQKYLTESSQLPAVISTPEGKDPFTYYPLFGIKVIGKSKDDNLFLDVILPEGWKIIPTEHSMCSELIDEKKNIIASIFYKAAFYDRSSFIAFKKEKK